jgi:hypothetical protein
VLSAEVGAHAVAEIELLTGPYVVAVADAVDRALALADGEPVAGRDVLEVVGA